MAYCQRKSQAYENISMTTSVWSETSLACPTTRPPHPVDLLRTHPDCQDLSVDLSISLSSSLYSVDESVTTSPCDRGVPDSLYSPDQSVTDSVSSHHKRVGLQRSQAVTKSIRRHLGFSSSTLNCSRLDEMTSCDLTQSCDLSMPESRDLGYTSKERVSLQKSDVDGGYCSGMRSSSDNTSSVSSLDETMVQNYLNDALENTASADHIECYNKNTSDGRTFTCSLDDTMVSSDQTDKRLYYCPDGSSEESVYHSGCSLQSRGSWGEEETGWRVCEERPVCLGQEDSPIRRSTRRSNTRSNRHIEERGRLTRGSTEDSVSRKSTRRSADFCTNLKKSDWWQAGSLRKSARKSRGLSEGIHKQSDLSLPTVDISMVESLNSDASSFMEKPLRPLGVTEDTKTLSKDRRKSLVHKLKKIGKHLHRKSTTGSTQHTTLALL